MSASLRFDCSLSVVGKGQFAFSFEIEDGKIQKIYIICNPEKRQHLSV